MSRELTGRHVLAIAVIAFGIVVAANLTMLFSATGTFPGLVVDNAYVASQGWDDRLKAQRELGWKLGIGYEPGSLQITIRDAKDMPVRDVPISVTIGRPTTDALDRQFAPEMLADSYAIPVTLAPGLWRLELAATKGPGWKMTSQIRVEVPD
ncbi:MAG: FixH family protein [Pseudomonadota bacterium]